MSIIVHTVTIKFTLPSGTSPEDVREVKEALVLYTNNPQFKEDVNDCLSNHLADMEYVPTLPNDPFDTDSLDLTIETQ